MKPYRDAWNTSYLKKGRLYGGATPALPDLPAGTTILDLGCGDGRAIPSMVRRGWSVTALDASPAALRLALRRSGGRSPISWIRADACCLPFHEASFDAVFCCHLLGHIPGPGRVRASAEAVRVTRPGGSLFISVFSLRDFRAVSGTEVEPGTFLRGDGTFTHYFSPSEARSLFPGHETGVETVSWKLRVRGHDLPREEIRVRVRKVA